MTTRRKFLATLFIAGLMAQLGLKSQLVGAAPPVPSAISQYFGTWFYVGDGNVPTRMFVRDGDEWVEKTFQ